MAEQLYGGEASADGDAKLRLDLYASGLLAFGSLSVVITSLLYVLSPEAAIAPVLTPLPGAMAAAASGAATLRAAGTSGVFGNVIMAVGCLMLAVTSVQRGKPGPAAGWAFILMSIVVFEIVDALTGFVLSQAAADAAGAPVYFSFRSLYAVFFLVGTAMFGLGAVLVLSRPVRSARAHVVACRIGMANGAVGLLSVLLVFIGFPLGQVVGASVGVGAIVFAIFGTQLARDAARQRSNARLS